MESIRKILHDAGASDLFESLSDSRHKLASYPQAEDSPPDHVEEGNPTRIVQLVIAYKQVSLHRSMALFDGAVLCVSAQNTHSMLACSRGHLETAAALGFLHRRLSLGSAGTVTWATIDAEITSLLIGSRDAQLTGMGAPNAKNVMSFFDHADRSVSETVLQKIPNQYEMLRKLYDSLSEFCHPNFHSGALSYDMEQNPARLTFRHGKIMRPQDIDLLKHLNLSAMIYCALYDDIQNVVPPSSKPIREVKGI